MFSFPSQRTSRTIMLAAIGLTLLGCNMNAKTNTLETAEYRQARFEQMNSLQNFQSCRTESLQHSDAARLEKSVGGYLTSARIAEKCLADVESNDHLIPPEERLRLQGIATLNYLRAGDIAAANKSLDRIKRNHPEMDLYFPDGTSFISSMEAFLKRTDQQSFGEFAALNVNRDIKREMRRIDHWKRN